jgi:hypothetical protein
VDADVWTSSSLAPGIEGLPLDSKEERGFLKVENKMAFGMTEFMGLGKDEELKEK